MRLTTFSDIKLPITTPESKLKEIARKKLGGEVKYFAIRKKSLDARDKNDLRYVYTIECSKEDYKEELPVLNRLPTTKHPKDTVLVVGTGPAGLFCALRLLERGITPLVIERGDPVETREQRVNAFFQTKSLDTESNIQFGEGGAGTFSDGKLNTQTHSPLNREVLRLFVRFGAPEEILWLAKPHIGSDNLKTVVKNMRRYILSQGGEILFRTRLEDIRVENGKVVSAVIKRFNAYTVGANPDFQREIVPVSAVVLAVGHSARDTFETLYARGVQMRSKDFAVGVRIEHLQEKIGFAQYGKNYPLLPSADYKLVSHAHERATFTFCMCPGGYVMPAASEERGVVTNGMSNYARDGKNANSALIAQVTKADFGSEHPLAGVEFQRKLERAAYREGGESYAAPVQRMEDFLSDRQSRSFGEVLPTYAAGTTFARLDAVLSQGVVEALKAGARDMDGRLRGFAHPDALLTGVESRTSSPVRIERDETCQSVTVKSLFPCGEGAGYAGGITSSAADGIRVAENLYELLLSNSI